MAARGQSIEPSRLVRRRTADRLSTISWGCDSFHKDGYTTYCIASLPVWQLLMQPPSPLSDHGLS